jgi:hypothetical protein
MHVAVADTTYSGLDLVRDGVGEVDGKEGI